MYVRKKGPKMKIILLQDVKSLGKEGDIVNVSDGYARNFVIPKKLGVEANDKNKNDLKLKKQHILDLDKKKIQLAEPIKSFGSFEIPIRLHPQVTGKFMLKVTEA